MSQEPMIRLEGLVKRFGQVVAVNRVSLLVKDGEFLTLLGPSGSGKTTVLRMIAGFENPDEGSIYLNGVDVTQLPPYERDVNTVFQDYALFPHMSVIENIEYGLRVKKVGKSERKARAEEALAQVQMSGYGDRSPAQLSGGQRQRVALARALVNQPRVLLLDEPLGALDLKLREQMQVELKQLQREIGITFIFVTHDQEEALTMSDRIAVFNEGKIIQLDTPKNIYMNPAHKFVAEFVGQTNKVNSQMANSLGLGSSEFTVRLEDVTISKSQHNGDRAVPAQVQDIIFVGATTRYLASTSAGVMVSTKPVEGETLAVEDSVILSWSSHKEHRSA